MPTHVEYALTENGKQILQDYMKSAYDAYHDVLSTGGDAAKALEIAKDTLREATNDVVIFVSLQDNTAGDVEHMLNSNSFSDFMQQSPQEVDGALNNLDEVTFTLVGGDQENSLEEVSFHIANQNPQNFGDVEGDPDRPVQDDIIDIGDLPDGVDASTPKLVDGGDQQNDAAYIKLGDVAADEQGDEFFPNGLPTNPVDGQQNDAIDIFLKIVTGAQQKLAADGQQNDAVDMFLEFGAQLQSDLVSGQTNDAVDMFLKITSDLPHNLTEGQQNDAIDIFLKIANQAPQNLVEGQQNDAIDIFLKFAEALRDGIIDIGDLPMGVEGQQSGYEEVVWTLQDEGSEASGPQEGIIDIGDLPDGVSAEPEMGLTEGVDASTPKIVDTGDQQNDAAYIKLGDVAAEEQGEEGYFPNGLPTNPVADQQEGIIDVGDLPDGVSAEPEMGLTEGVDASTPKLVDTGDQQNDAAYIKLGDVAADPQEGIIDVGDLPMGVEGQQGDGYFDPFFELKEDDLDQAQHVIKEHDAKLTHEAAEGVEHDIHVADHHDGGHEAHTPDDLDTHTGDV